VELEGIVDVSVMMGEIVGEVRISFGMGSSRNCWFRDSEWTVASDTDGEVGVSIEGGSFKGGGGSSPSASSNTEVGVFMSY
jgi:hypothetical protein